MRLLKEAGHRRWRQDLSAFVDGHLGPPRRQALEMHLATCRFCQEEVAALRRLVALLQRLPQVESPRSFVLAQAPSVGLRWPALYGGSLRYATAVVSMLLLAVVVGDLAIGRPSGTSLTGPGVAETTTAPATGAVQDLSQAQATPSPQALPFTAAEKALQPRVAEVPSFVVADEVGTLHKWVRGVEVVLGGLLASLVSVIAFQSWRGRRQSQG